MHTLYLCTSRAGYISAQAMMGSRARARQLELSCAVESHVARPLRGVCFFPSLCGLLTNMHFADALNTSCLILTRSFSGQARCTAEWLGLMCVRKVRPANVRVIFEDTKIRL